LIKNKHSSTTNVAPTRGAKCENNAGLTNHLIAMLECLFRALEVHKIKFHGLYVKKEPC